MNGNSDPNTKAKMSKGSPSYPDVNGRERTEFMTFHPKQGSSDRLDFSSRPLVEAVYESIKGSRSASRLGHYDLDVDDEGKSDGEPPELPATSFPRGSIISGPNYTPPIPMSLRNGDQQKESGNFVEVDTLNHIETESSETMMIPLTELPPPDPLVTTKSNLSKASSFFKPNSQSRLDQSSEPNVLGKIHRDLDYLLERRDQKKLLSSENLKL
jgi:hypothetical protein